MDGLKYHVYSRKVCVAFPFVCEGIAKRAKDFVMGKRRGKNVLVRLSK